jgi:hypothetical protein
MVTEELITIIKSKFRDGERREDIKYSLLQEGWEGVDIEAAIGQIQRDALKQLPILSTFYAFIERMEAKTAHSSPKMTFAVLGGSFMVVLLIFWGLFLMLDPLGTKIGERDIQRETDVVKIRNGLNKYYTARFTYPPALSDLVPDFLQSIPRDPKTGAEYPYKLQGESNYSLCVNFESKTPQCLAAEPSSSSIPVVTNQSDSTETADPNQMPTPIESGPTATPSVMLSPSAGATTAL